MKFFYTDHFELPLPPGHFFPMAKYGRLRNRLAAEVLRAGDELLVPPAADDQQLSLAHDPEYVRRASVGDLTRDELRRINFPWSPAMIERSRRSSGATLAAARAALREGVAANLAGGTHHAFPDAGEGYCVFNDTAVAARVLLHEGLIRAAVILDCDAHQGNGTAVIFQNDPRAYTFSIHTATGFPRQKERSRLDIALPDDCSDAEYLSQLAPGLQKALDESAADLALFIAGADPLHSDRLGRMRLSRDGLAARDRMVLSACRARTLPTAICMGGGYARDVDEIVDVHLATLRIAQELSHDWPVRQA